MADDGESIFAKAGFDLPGRTAPAAGKPAEPKKATTSIFEAAGFKLPGAAKEETPAIASNIPTPERFAEGVAKYGVNNQKSGARKVIEALDAINPVTLLSKGIENAGPEILEHMAAGWQQAKQGFSEIRAGNLAPSYAGPGQAGKSTNLAGETESVPGIPQYAPGGLLRAASGLAAIPSSLVTGPVNALVARPVTELTGNPDIGERAGFVANALIPIRGGGKVAKTVSPSTKATNALVNAIGPENVPELVAGLRQNPRMTPADLSDPVRLTTQGLMAGGTPDVQQFISTAVKERAGSRLEAANTAYTDAMGPKPDVVKMVEGLKDRARTAGQQAIQPALANAKPVDVSPVIKAIDEKLKPGITALMGETKLPLSDLEQELIRFKSRLTDGENQVFDPQKLHRIQSDIGDQAFQLSKSPNPKDRMLGSQLRGFNEKLIDQIDDASGGAYRPARAKFKDAKDIHEAFDSGFDTLKNRSGVSGLEDRPESFREWMKTATPEEVVARRIGTRADIDQKINGVKNGALAGQTVTAIPYNQEKLTALFGEREAGRLIRVMQDAKREADTNYAISSGSKTAETKAAADRIKVREVGGGNPLQYFAPVAAEMLGSNVLGPGVGFAASLGAKGVHMTAQKLGQMHDIAKNMAFARNALATGSARETTINALLSHPKVVRELQKRSNALTIP